MTARTRAGPACTGNAPEYPRVPAAQRPALSRGCALVEAAAADHLRQVVFQFFHAEAAEAEGPGNRLGTAGPALPLAKLDSQELRVLRVLCVNPIRKWGSIQTQFERPSKITFSVFSPFFRVHRVRLRASHMRGSPRPLARAHAFSAMGYQAPRSVVRNSAALTAARAGSRRGNSRARAYPARGRNRDIAVLLKVRDLFFGACRTVARGNKKARDCGISAGRAASGRTAGEWPHCAKSASRCQGRNPVQKIKLHLPGTIRIFS